MQHRTFMMILTFILLASGAGVIGWIGFQEHFRLLERSFENEQEEKTQAVEMRERAVQLQDHRTIETRAEVSILLDDIDHWLQDLESDGLPEE